MTFIGIPLQIQGGTDSGNSAIDPLSIVPQESVVASGGGPSIYADVIQEVRCPKRIFNLSKPLVVVVNQAEWSHECPELGIYACGESEADSYADFALAFAISWDGLAGEPDHNLTIDARKLRDSFRSYVHDIEDVL